MPRRNLAPPPSRLTLVVGPKPSVPRVRGTGYRLVRGVVLAMRSARSALFTSARVTRNAVHRMLRRSDYRRWVDLANYEAWWDERNVKIARLIQAGSRVIEFGAGRRLLEKRLDPMCTYVASDLVERGAGTFVCDLNRRPLPDLAPLNVDTAVFGGVLEYIHDVESLVAWLAEQVSVCVASYACAPSTRKVIGRIRTRLDRFYYGYMNGFAEPQIVGVFERAGFRCQAMDSWGSQRIFLFVNERRRRG